MASLSARILTTPNNLYNNSLGDMDVRPFRFQRWVPQKARDAGRIKGSTILGGLPGIQFFLDSVFFYILNV